MKRLIALLAVGLVGCTVAEPEPPAETPTLTTAEPTPSPTPTVEPALRGPELGEATAAPQDVVTGLDAPWDLEFLPGGAVLITLRDAGQVVLTNAAGSQVLGGPGAEALAAGTDPDSEGGLLGIAASPEFETDRSVYLYRTTARHNEVVRAELDAAAGTLGELETVIDGIPASPIHNGGRIAFGPDGMLYVATGDARDAASSRRQQSLAGKILRLTPDGEPAPGNPFPDSPVWSLGHRNVQGLGWDDQGRMFASEFGQNRFDELNLIAAGADYGWPVTEGTGDVSGVTNPLVTWAPSEASPSGITVTADGVYLAALRGARLWFVPFDGDGYGSPEAFLVGELGRLRHVELGPDGALWILTNNTDGRGDPRAGDDRLVRMLAP